MFILCSFYESIGFKVITANSKWLAFQEVINHFKEFKATKTLLTYILPVNFLIDHLSIKFINHVMESLAEVDFNITGKSLIKEVLDIVISTNIKK